MLLHCLCRLKLVFILEINLLEIIDDGAVEDNAEDEDNNENHHKGPHEANEGIREREDHGAKAFQGLDRPHDANHADQSEDAQDAEERKVQHLHRDGFEDGSQDQETVEEVPLVLFTEEEVLLVPKDPDDQLQCKPTSEEDVESPGFTLFLLADEGAVAVAQCVVRRDTDVQCVRHDHHDREAAEHMVRQSSHFSTPHKASGDRLDAVQ
mmetsp:Transcript_78186/g.217119  ORF Transcript_78186/g.217119 Transcript_78186/m.217119 type:complete len:209 (+) Transcript_78186:850-1476(+)